jgi:hypothetical protein
MYKLKKIALLVIIVFYNFSIVFAIDVKGFYDKYKVNIIFTKKADTWNLVTYKMLSETEKEKLFNLTSTAFSKYPKSFFEKINLKTIVLCKDLSFQNTNRAAVPDNYQNTLYLSYKDSYQDYYIVHCIFHEMNHYAEYSIWNDYRYHWKEWEELYKGTTNGGEIAYNNPSVDYYSLDETLKGFLNQYSTLGQEEDRSEIIAYFMNDLNDEHSNMMKILKKDLVLQKKTKKMLQFYKDKFGFDKLLETYNAEIQ